MKEACNEVCYVSRIIEKGNESDVDTGVLVDGRTEDLHHLTVVLLRHRVYISLLPHKDIRNMIMHCILNQYYLAAYMERFKTKTSLSMV